jgi:hypothetical protein
VHISTKTKKASENKKCAESPPKHALSCSTGWPWVGAANKFSSSTWVGIDCLDQSFRVHKRSLYLHVVDFSSAVMIEVTEQTIQLQQ